MIDGESGLVVNVILNRYTERKTRGIQREVRTGECVYFTQ